MTRYDINDGKIRIFFDTIPSRTICSAMRQYGYLWNRNGMFWHAEHTPEREAFAREMLRERPLRERRSIADIARDFRHICWYPSSGTDFSEIYFLSKRYYEQNNIPLDNGQELPDLFILTDVNGSWEFDDAGGITQLKEGRYYHLNPLFSKNYLIVEPVSVERLEDAPDIISERFCQFSERKKHTGKAYYIKANAFLDGERQTVNIIYAFTENTIFARNVLLKDHIPVEYGVQIRYGSAFGGSSLRGDWYKHITGELGCKYFVSDRGYMESPEFLDENNVAEFFEGYRFSAPRYTEIYNTDNKDCSEFRSVAWYKLDNSVT